MNKKGGYSQKIIFGPPPPPPISYLHDLDFNQFPQNNVYFVLLQGQVTVQSITGPSTAVYLTGQEAEHLEARTGQSRPSTLRLGQARGPSAATRTGQGPSTMARTGQAPGRCSHMTNDNHMRVGPGGRGGPKIVLWEITVHVRRKV